VIVAGADARGIALLANPVFASFASREIRRMHAAGERAPVLEGGVAAVTAAGRAVAADAVARAAGIAACAMTTAAELLAASLEDLGLAAVAFGHRGAAGTVAGCSNDGTAIGIAQRWAVAA
jgi:hypothetical protein